MKNLVSTFWDTLKCKFTLLDCLFESAVDCRGPHCNFRWVEKNRYKLTLFRVYFILSIISIQTTYSQELSPYAEVSLLTAGPGEALYSTFGHTAIRVLDPQKNIDKVYGYGTFDFDDLFFYVKFARGKLNYKLDIDPYNTTQTKYGFIDIYRYLNRTVDEQILNINQEQKQAIYDFLEHNYLPENRYYLYDFFFDNCATRPKDVFKEALGTTLVFNHDYLPESMTFRELIDTYLGPKPWGDFGIDLALGAVIDRPMEPEEYMFLPDYLAKALDAGKLVANGEEKPIVKQKQRLYESTRSYEVVPFYQNPAFPAWILAIVVVLASVIGFKQNTYKPWVDMLVFGAAGLAGLIVFLLMTATDHTATAWNMNVLWLLPTHLALPFVLRRTVKPKWLFPYFAIAGGLIVLLLLFWPILPQKMNPTFIPLMLMLLIRLGWGIWRMK